MKHLEVFLSLLSLQTSSMESAKQELKSPGAYLPRSCKVISLQVVPGQAGGGSFPKNKPIGNGHVAGSFAELRCSLTKQVGTDQWSESESATVNCLAGKSVVHAIKNRDDSAAY